MNHLRVVATGFFMGIADLIPGVSGGTIAYISGIYERWVRALASIDHHFLLLLARWNFKKAFTYIDFIFLVVLYGGVLTGAFLGAKFVHNMITRHPLQLFAFFLGLIIASGMWLLLSAIRKYRTSMSNLYIFIFVMAGLLSGFILVTISEAGLPEGLFFTFLSGFIAICAMVLPGISGAYVLVILGKYVYILGLVSAFMEATAGILKGEEVPLEPLLYRVVLPLLVFIAGIAAGLISFTKIVKWLFARHRGPIEIFFSSFIIGTSPKLYPWKEDLVHPEISPPLLPWDAQYDPQYLSVTIFFLIGVLLYGAIEKAYISKVKY